MATTKDYETYAIIDTIAKVAKKQADAKEPDSLRSMLDADLMDAYRTDGTDRRRVIINGVDVGMHSVVMSKQTERDEIVINDVGDLIRWLQTTDEGTDTLRAVIQDSSTARGAVLKAAKGYGFLPDGCTAEHIIDEPRPKGTRFAITPEKVFSAYGGELPHAIAGVLMPGGGE